MQAGAGSGGAAQPRDASCCVELVFLMLKQLSSAGFPKGCGCLEASRLFLTWPASGSGGYDILNCCHHSPRGGQTYPQPRPTGLERKRVDKRSQDPQKHSECPQPCWGARPRLRGLLGGARSPQGEPVQPKGDGTAPRATWGLCHHEAAECSLVLRKVGLEGSRPIWPGPPRRERLHRASSRQPLSWPDGQGLVGFSAQIPEQGTRTKAGLWAALWARRRPASPGLSCSQANPACSGAGLVG